MKIKKKKSKSVAEEGKEENNQNQGLQCLLHVLNSISALHKIILFAFESIKPSLVSFHEGTSDWFAVHSVDTEQKVLSGIRLIPIGMSIYKIYPKNLDIFMNDFAHILSYFTACLQEKKENQVW